MDKSDVQTEDAENNLKTSQDCVPGDSNLKLTQPNDSPSSPAVAHDKKLSSQIDPANSQAPVASEEQSNSKVDLEGQNSNPASHPADVDDANNDRPNVERPVEAEQQNTTKGREDNPVAETESKDQQDPKSPAKDQNRGEDRKEVVKDTHSSMLEGTVASENAEGEEEVAGKFQSHIGQLPFQLPVSEVPPKKKEALNDAHHQSESEQIVKGPAEEILQSDTEGLVNGQREPENKSALPSATKATIKSDVVDSPSINKSQPATPDFPLRYSSRRSGSHGGETFKCVFNDAKMAENDDGTPEEQAAFIKELENFSRQRGVDFKPPKFYGQPLNCYKLWTSVIKLGGYDLVTATKLWRQVGESFHPPKTCTTVSWTFRIFYEKSLLEYERYKVQNGDVELPAAALPEPSGADNEGNGLQASGSGRARRDAAARAMQGWHAQRLLGYGEDKTPDSFPKRENKIKSIGSLKQKRPSEAELPVKAQKTETYKQLVTTVVDVGPPADWVKINVRETKDCFEVYALVPGLLREEVRVQSDPAGRLVITGQPEQTDNPWGITAFKKVVNLPARIDPLQTSAVVSLHGRLFVRVPFEHSNV